MSSPPVRLRTLELIRIHIAYKLAEGVQMFAACTSLIVLFDDLVKFGNGHRFCGRSLNITAATNKNLIINNALTHGKLRQNMTKCS